MTIATHVSMLRPHKVDSQFIVSTFPIFQAEGRSLFIIHWPFSFIKVSDASQKWVWHAQCEGQRLHMDDRFVEIGPILGWLLFAELNTVEK